MNIEDFKIEIKTYSRKGNVVIANVLVFSELEIRGFTARYTYTKDSPTCPVWVVSPPSQLGRNNTFFYMVWFKNPTLWQQLQGKIKEAAEDYTNKNNLTI